MKGTVIKEGRSWKYTDSMTEGDYSRKFEYFDDVEFVPITDSWMMETCVIKKGDKYGVYLLDTVDYVALGTWCTPTSKPFPYDEVKYCTFPFDYDRNEPGFFAFRIKEKWGVLKVWKWFDSPEEPFDAEYGSTRQRVIVPCEYASLSELEKPLGKSYDWKDPFSQDESDVNYQ